MTKSKARAKPNGPTIEGTIEQLEKLLESLEREDTSLEESLAAFEAGVNLIREAQTRLAEAEQQVQLLIEKNNEPLVEEVDFAGDDG